MDTKTVLLGAGGTGTSFAIASRIRANWSNEVRLIVTDIHDAHLVTTSVLADTFCKVPPASTPAFETALRDIILKEKVDVYIPILNEEIILAARLSADAALSHVDIWSSPLHASCTDKLYADEWLKNLGIPTPGALPANAAQDSSLWFVKPRSGLGSKGTGTLTLADIKHLPADERNNLLVQEICQRPEVTVDSFFNTDTGECYAYCRERIETKAGVCTKARLFADPVLTGFAQTIGAALRQRGTICFQVMKLQGNWVVTDLNLRSGAGTAMTCAAGFDVLAAAFACRTGQSYTHYLKPLSEQQSIYITRQYAEFVMQAE